MSALNFATSKTSANGIPCIQMSFDSSVWLQWGTFLLFAGCVAIMTMIVAFLLPETKGVPLEEVNGIWARHPVWCKVVRQGSSREAGNSVEQSGVQSGLPWDSL